MKRAFLAVVLSAAIVAGAAAASGKPSLLNPSSLHKKAPATFRARFVTTKGTFVVKTTRSWAPIGADRFYNLVLNHFYDNQPLFRVEPGFVVQWGISMKPPVAKAWKHAYIKDDANPLNNSLGRVTFANAGANTRTTQLFVNLRANGKSLGPTFAPFGEVTKGFSVFGKLYHGSQARQANANQAWMAANGAAAVHKYFPKLDWIKTARIIP
jgi:peptidyl-prolyl cis-trans isomerase A (cyclophilin A)